MSIFSITAIPTAARGALFLPVAMPWSIQTIRRQPTSRSCRARIGSSSIQIPRATGDSSCLTAGLHFPKKPMTEHLLRAELSPVIYQPQQFRLSSGDPQEQTEFQGASCGVSKASGQPRAEQAVATRFTAENA